MATGSVAGRLVGSPVRRSKHDPCIQHSMVGAPPNSSTSPSDSGTSACEHTSWTSESLQTRSKAMSGHLDGLLVQPREGPEAALDRAHEPVPQLRDADVVDDV